MNTIKLSDGRIQVEEQTTQTRIIDPISLETQLTNLLEVVKKIQADIDIVKSLNKEETDDQTPSQSDGLEQTPPSASLTPNETPAE